MLFALCAGCASFSVGGGHGGARAGLPFQRTALQSGIERRPSAQAKGVGVYLKDRANDFADIFSLSLSLGFGALVNVRVTQALQCGGFFWGGSRFGFIGREGWGWSETEIEMGLPGFYIRSVLIEPGAGIVGPMDTERGQSLWQFLGDEGVPYDKGYDRKFWQVGATVHAGLAGLDFSVNLKELLDFLLGWAAIDISGDDTVNRMARAAKRKDAQ